MVAILLIIVSGLITFTTSGDFFKEWTRKLSTKGWFVCSLISIGIIFGIIEHNSSEKEAKRLIAENQNLQIKSDTLQSNIQLFRENFDLKTEISQRQNDLLQLTADSLKIRVENLSEKNEVDKKQREFESISLKRKIAQLDEQLRIAQKTINDNIKTSRPQIDICQPVKWGKAKGQDSLYSIYVPICNTGKRTAEKISEKVCIIYKDKKANAPISIFEPQVDTFSALTSFSETDYMLFKLLHQYSIQELKGLQGAIIVYLEFEYIDPLTGENLSSNRCFSWRSYDEDYLNFNTSQSEDIALAKSFFKRKNF